MYLCIIYLFILFIHVFIFLFIYVCIYLFIYVFIDSNLLILYEKSLILPKNGGSDGLLNLANYSN